MKSKLLQRISVLVLIFMMTMGTVAIHAEELDLEAPLKLENALAIHSKFVYLEFSEAIDFDALEEATWDVREYNHSQAVFISDVKQATLEQAELYNPEYDTIEEQNAATTRGVVLELEEHMDKALYRVTVHDVKALDGGYISPDDNVSSFVGRQKETDRFDIDSVIATSSMTVEVTFENSIEAGPASLVRNFSINSYPTGSPVIIIDAELKADQKTVLLTVLNMENGHYILKCRNQKDLEGNHQIPESEIGKLFYVLE